MFDFYEPGELVDDELKLVLVETHPGDLAMGFVPSYKFEMVSADDGKRLGEINLRVGHLYHLEMYSGHIGYKVDLEHRGNRYAARSILLLKPLMKKHGFQTIWITCDSANIASRRTCEIAGAVLVEVVNLPEDTDLYKRGFRQGCRYRLDI